MQNRTNHSQDKIAEQTTANKYKNNFFLVCFLLIATNKHSLSTIKPKVHLLLHAVLATIKPNQKFRASNQKKSPQRKLLTTKTNRKVLLQKLTMNEIQISNELYVPSCNLFITYIQCSFTTATMTTTTNPTLTIATQGDE